MLRIDSAHNSCYCRVLCSFCLIFWGSPVKQLADKGTKHFYMSNFLCTNIHQHVLILFFSTAVKSLKEILHHNRHFPKLSPQYFLYLAGKHWIWAVNLYLKL